MENLKNIISKIDVPLFIIYGFMGFGSIYIAAFIRERMDLSFWAELFAVSYTHLTLPTSPKV